jgi:hypothetical protein
MTLVIGLLALLAPAAAQVVTSNPLDEIKAKLETVLEQAGVPFTDEQTRELALVMEEQRQASERLFGDIMDFSNGPVRGADRDRALAGIQWMTEAFEAKLTDVLTPDQNQAWTAFRAAEVLKGGGLPALRLVLSRHGVPLDPEQDRLTTEIYQSAAQRLREALEENAGAAPIEDEALGRVVDLLTGPQAHGLVTASQDPRIVSRDDAGGNGGDGNGGNGGPSGDFTQAPPRESIVAALRALALPTAAPVAAAGTTEVRSSRQIAQIRLNNNAFTTENFGGGGGPGFGGGRMEVIQRGGTGDYHGNFSFDFRDESLTARNFFADNKPPFQQRNINANVSGPFLRDRLTASLTFNQNERENADTVVAITPDGDLSFGIVRPELQRTYSGNGQMQLAGNHSLLFNARYFVRSSENNGVGRFTLPERASTSGGSEISLAMREIWVVSPHVIHEVGLSHFGNENANVAVTRGVKIDVLDAFNSGGADRDNWRRNRNYTLWNLFWHEGDRLTFKAGTEWNYRTATSFSQDNFFGQFEFSSLDDFIAGRPQTFSVTEGEPMLSGSQLEFAGFVQNDFRVNRRLTVFAGVRYERQTNITDDNNIDPRVGFAYSPGPATIIRGGAGLFHGELGLGLVQDVRRLDGTRQYEIVVSDPSYPDPFAGGTTEVVYPSSRRLFAPDLRIPYEARASLSVERTLPWNISVTASYDFERGVDRFRTRNLNAPLPGETVRPDPSAGNILQLESASRSRSHSVRVGGRQRLSFLTYSAGYTLSSDLDDGEGPFWQPMNSYDPGADWGRAGFNQRHRYNFTVNVQAPFGMMFTADAFGNSGNPYNIITGTDDNGDQHISDRPAGVARNSANGPRFFNVNMTLSKTFRLQGSGGGGGAQLSVYANMNNAFNIVNLRNPSGVLTSEYFGMPTSASQARDVEIGMRYQF